jgi:xylulokinase
MSDLFLGLDSSTQSLSAVVIDLATRRVVCEQSLNFDRDLPHYGTRDGVHRSADGREVHAPPLMWAEALDLLLARLRAAGLDLGAVRAVAGSGQQHGSVYLNERAQGVLAALDPRPAAGRAVGRYLQPGHLAHLDGCVDHDPVRGDPCCAGRDCGHG